MLSAESIDQSKQEKAIGKFFKTKKTEVDPVNFHTMTKSALNHINAFLDAKTESVLDVGCGPGAIMLGLQIKGVKNVIGVDLSESAIDLAKKRIAKFGDKESAEFFSGSFFDYPVKDIDGVSHHFTLCCHPNVNGMIIQTLACNPKIVAMSLPKYNLFNRILIGLASVLMKPFTKGFRGYAHSTKNIDEKMINQGYELNSYKEGFYWETRIYKLK